MPPPSRESVAKAIAFYEACDDAALLHRLIGEIAPKAKAMVGRHLRTGPEENIPGPAELRAAREPATRAEAVATLRAVDDFGLLQVLARAIGQRVEAIEIAASADFPVGTRVLVPQRPGFPPAGPNHAGSVEQTGTMLEVLLDNGETWAGPPSLARLEGSR